MRRRTTTEAAYTGLGVGAIWRAMEPRTTEGVMLYWAAVFLIIAIVAAIFGFGGVASAAGDIAQVLFFIFLVLFVVSIIVGLFRGRRPRI